MQIVKAMVVALAILGAGHGAKAQDTLTEIEIEDIVRGLAEEAQFERIAEALGLTEPLKPIFAEHFRLVFSSDEVVTTFSQYFVTEQSVFDVETREELTEIALLLGAGWAQETATLGAARLAPSQQRRTLEFGLATVEAMSTEVCAANTRGALDPLEIAQVEAQVMATQDPAEVMGYLAMLRAALTAEVTDNPAFEPMSERQKSRAGQAYQDAFVAGIEAHPNRQAVLQAVENFDRAPDQAICDLTKISLQSALSIEGETGELVVRLLTSG